MKIEVLLVQFLILAFTAVLWWIARRDLATRPAAPPAVPPAETADLEQLCATLETLVTRLSRRLDGVERQLTQGTIHDAPSVTSPEPARISEPVRMEEELARIADGLARMEEGLAQRQGEKQAEPAYISMESALTPLSAPSPTPFSAPPMLETMQETMREPEPAPDPRYALVYAMLDEGVTDPVEIARHTGLGRGEVELIISLRERRAF